MLAFDLCLTPSSPPECRNYDERGCQHQTPADTRHVQIKMGLIFRELHRVPQLTEAIYLGEYGYHYSMSSRRESQMNPIILGSKICQLPEPQLKSSEFVVVMEKPNFFSQSIFEHVVVVVASAAMVASLVLFSSQISHRSWVETFFGTCSTFEDGIFVPPRGCG